MSGTLWLSDCGEDEKLSGLLNKERTVMPDALIVHDEHNKDPAWVLKMLEAKGIVKRISVLKTNVWARYTMNQHGVRRAYYKEKRSR